MQDSDIERLLESINFEVYGRKSEIWNLLDGAPRQIPWYLKM